MYKTLPEGWKMVKLGQTENTIIIMGQSPPSSTYNTNGNGLPFYQGKAEFGEHHPVAVKWCSAPVKIAEPDDILISVRAPVGDVNICQTKSCVGRGLAAIRTNTTLNSKFLYWYFKRDINIWERLTTGSTFSAISSKTLHNLSIPLPPLPTQKRIVEILEEADGLRKLRKEADEKMKDLIPSLFVKMFGDPATNPKGWEMVRLGEVGEIITGNTPSKKEKKFYSNRYINFFKPNDFTSDAVAILQASEDFLSEDGCRVARIVPPGSVLTTCIGIIGKVGITTDDSCFNQQINAIKPNMARINSSFLAYAITERKAYLERFTNAPVVPIINKSQFSLFKIPLPSLSLQQEFAARVEEIEAEKARQAKSKAKFNDLFNSLMQKAFKGELVA